MSPSMFLLVGACRFPANSLLADRDDASSSDKVPTTTESTKHNYWTICAGGETLKGLLLGNHRNELWIIKSGENTLNLL